MSGCSRRTERSRAVVESVPHSRPVVCSPCFAGSLPRLLICERGRGRGRSGSQQACLSSADTAGRAKGKTTRQKILDAGLALEQVPGDLRSTARAARTDSCDAHDIPCARGTRRLRFGHRQSPTGPARQARRGTRGCGGRTRATCAAGREREPGTPLFTRPPARDFASDEIQGAARIRVWPRARRGAGSWIEGAQTRGALREFAANYFPSALCAFPNSGGEIRPSRPASNFRNIALCIARKFRTEIEPSAFASNESKGKAPMNSSLSSAPSRFLSVLVQAVESGFH